MAIGRRRTAAWTTLLVALLLAGCGSGDGEARAAERPDGERPDGTRRALAAAPNLAASSGPSQELPEGVTPSMVRQGEELFGGGGFCYTCHGASGEGVPQLGANLTDDEWSHTDGSYRGLVERIRDGVSAEASSVGVPMPPRGGGRLSDDQIRALAAYVWVLSRGGT